MQSYSRIYGNIAGVSCWDIRPTQNQRLKNWRMFWRRDIISFLQMKISQVQPTNIAFVGLSYMWYLCVHRYVWLPYHFVGSYIFYMVIYLIHKLNLVLRLHYNEWTFFSFFCVCPNAKVVFQWNFWAIDPFRRYGSHLAQSIGIVAV